jgi:ATP-dependent helicase HrpB
MEALPIYEALPEALSVLASGNRLVLQAPPGAGKSTVFPLELLKQNWLGDQKILLLEPRRLSARSVAERMAHLLGEPVGQRVGYRVRFETKVSSQTRLEVITEGILSNLIRKDSLLEGVGAVVLDEFHERGLQGDWALALLKEVQNHLRPELRLVVMSATLDTEMLTRYLDAPLVESRGKMFPVEIQYLGSEPNSRIETHVLGALRMAVAQFEGDILVFLPGKAEIMRTLELLKLQNWAQPLSLHCLYGEMPFEEQDAALRKGASRKVVLSTSIAETSLTIEGVRVVVDSGLSRVPRYDVSSGLTRLDTVRLTADSAQQRAGRAGRTAAGNCLRLWDKNLWLEPSRQPEILQADLTSLALEWADWGSDDLDWLTPPPAGSLAAARSLLMGLGAIDSQFKIKPFGKKLLAFPTHPRLAAMLLKAQERGLSGLGADLLALVEEKDPLRRSDVDIGLRLAELLAFRQKMPFSGDKIALQRIERLSKSWRNILNNAQANTLPHQENLGWLLAAAYPDRIGKHIGQGRYKLSGGKIVSLSQNDPFSGQELLVAAQLNDEKIFLAAAVEAQDLAFLAQSSENIFWDKASGALKAQKETKIGQMVLHSEPLRKFDSQAKLNVLLEVVQKEGQQWLNWDENCQNWQNRVLSLRQWNGELWPDVSTESLLKEPKSWLGGYLDAVFTAQDFKKLPLAEILIEILPWPLRSKLEELAPAKLSVPSGSQIALSYDSQGSQPILAVRLQELFGLLEVPKINEGKVAVMLHLLSPGYRPVQVTQDLRSFWQNTYPIVRKELRIRYPKHHWPEDPWTAQAVRGVKKRVS